MQKILLSGDFEEDINELIIHLQKLEEDFDIINFIKEYPFFLTEHPESKNKAVTISIQDLFDKIWFENQLLLKQGYLKWTFSQKAEAIEKVKNILFSANTALGMAKIDKDKTKKGFSFKSINYFLKKNKPKGFEQTIAIGGGTKMANNKLNKFLGKEKSEANENTNDSFWDPIQNDIKNDLFNKLKSSNKTDYNDL